MGSRKWECGSGKRKKVGRWEAGKFGENAEVGKERRWEAGKVGENSEVGMRNSEREERKGERH